MKNLVHLIAVALSTCAALATDVRFGVDNLIETDFAPPPEDAADADVSGAPGDDAQAGAREDAVSAAA